MKVDNLVIGSNLESVIYTYLTDSKLLLYGSDFPDPWETIEDDFYYLLEPHQIFKFSFQSKKFDITSLDITTKSALYRALLTKLKLLGKLLYYKCDKFTFLDENKINYYFNNNANPQKIEFNNLYFINFNRKEDELEFLFDSVDLYNYMEVYNIYRRSENSGENLFKLIETGLKYPNKYCEYALGGNFYLMSMFYLTKEEYDSGGYPDLSETLVRTFLHRNPKLFLQRNIQKIISNFDSNRERYFKSIFEIKYSSTEFIKFENFNLDSLLKELKMVSQTEYKLLKHG